MSFTRDDVLDALQQASVDATKTKTVLQNLKTIEDQKKEEKEAEKTPKQKNQFVVFVMDDGTLTGKDLIGYVLQIPEDKDVTTTPSSFIDACRNYNNTARKARKYPVTKIGDGMKTVRGKYLKDFKLKIKTKESILVIPVKNDIDNPKKLVSIND